MANVWNNLLKSIFPFANKNIKKIIILQTRLRDKCTRDGLIAKAEISPSKP